DNLIKNNGEAVPANLQDDSSGYVVVLGDCDLIGNFRIIDDSGYEYRSNMPGLRRIDDFISNYIANFNTVNGANQADVVGYSYKFVADLPDRTVANFDEGWNYDIFVLDMNEEPLSCDTRNFACGNVMNYGINEDYPNSKGNDLLCPGGGLADPQGGYVSFENARLNVTIPPFNFMEESPIFTGLIGINNGDGTGSMDSWIEGEIFIPTF
ncbi:MAG: hypothetical protein GTO02_09750, partial [Candidatus Dadabacteria bacterium]|nr:hypothetical protein [Candidatus Dadabacteria bacterium]NIQ14659.1 hypothetical protein [Candidatus Dadabacteria bacterium]